MPEFTSLQNAVSFVKDNDYVWSNAFLALVNPIELQTALGQRVKTSGSPKNLTYCCTAGFGDWIKDSANEDFVRYGAVKSVILGHLTSTPTTVQKILNCEIEGYNLPLGVMSKMVRAAAAGERYYITDVGLNLFIDPIYGDYRLNAISKEEYVTEVVIDQKRRLKYKIPPMDVAFIKASSADIEGNVSFEKEGSVADALSLAQAVHLRKGRVIVQVERILKDHQRPWNVVIPAPLIDFIVVCPGQTQIAGIDEYSPAYAGDKFYASEPIRDMVISREQESPPLDAARSSVVRRAVAELLPGHIANIGIGIPELVAVEAAKNGVLAKVTLTVESGAMKGAPASGKAFGAVIGAHSISNMAQMFDLYDGGGLDVCFLGALEIDRFGNVNSHMSDGKLSGIGGFANISQNTPKVVFCTTFSAGGLEVHETNGMLSIQKEGKYTKFVSNVKSVSFSAINAKNTNQEVLYITERCVFRLVKEGLELIEIMPGIDLQRDILSHIPFGISISEGLKQAVSA